MHIVAISSCCTNFRKLLLQKKALSFLPLSKIHFKIKRMSSFSHKSSTSSFYEEEPSFYELAGRKGVCVNWDNSIQPRKTDLLQLLERMVKNREKTNIVVTVGSRHFKCHLMVLQAYSEFFWDLEEVTSVEVPTEKVSPEAFHFIYDWMLSTNAKVHRQGFLEVFVAANFLKINELVEQCWTCMDSTDHFLEDSAFQLYLEARHLGDKITPALMISRISRFFLTLVSLRDFVEMDVDEVVMILSSHNIAVHSESEVLYAALRWLHHDWDTRKTHRMAVIQCVRFGLISPWQLVEYTRGANSPELMELVREPEVYKLVEDGLHFVVSKYHYSSLDLLYNVMERLKLDEPSERMWIADKESSESHSEDSKCMNYWLTNYQTFLEYLEMVKKRGLQYWKQFVYVKSPIDLKPSDPRFNAALQSISESLVRGVRARGKLVVEKLNKYSFVAISFIHAAPPTTKRGCVSTQNKHC